MARNTFRLAPVHPGEILAADFLAPINLTKTRLAFRLRVPPKRISAIISGKRGINADTALRLGRYFGTSAEVWMELQGDYDLAVARDAVGAEIERSVLVPEKRSA